MSYLTPGQIFAERYSVGHFIAEGGMGTVYAAEHLTTEMRVAIKVLRPHMLANESVAKQFELEAKVAARVRSPNIVQVLDAGSDYKTGLSFLVMELLDGASLEQLLAERGALSPELTVQYLQQVAAGLDGAHSYMDETGALRPIVHRDLKPENLFVVGPDSAQPTVKILDFGIAKVLSNTSGVSQDLRGTPLYMAAEQATGRPVTPQTDIWALGLIAFYALVGRSYWKSARADGTLASLVHEITTGPTPPSSVRAKELGSNVQLPQAFDTWLSRCLLREPSERFSSAGEAVSALAAALGVDIPYPAFSAHPSAHPSAPRLSQLTETVPTGGAIKTGELPVASTHSPSTKETRIAPALLVAAGSLALAVGWYVLRPTAQTGTPVPPTSLGDGVSTPEAVNAASDNPVSAASGDSEGLTGSSPSLTSKSVPPPATTATTHSVGIRLSPNKESSRRAEAKVKARRPAKAKPRKNTIQPKPVDREVDPYNER